MSDCLFALAEQLRGRRVMVTGVAGFVGANLLRLLAAAGCEPHGVIRPGGPAWRLTDVIGKVVLHEADLVDERQIETVFSQVRPEYVFHLAVPRGNSEASRDEMLRFNVFGAVALCRLARAYGTTRLIVAGSSLEYGPSSNAVSESHAVAPLTWHGATKAAATLLFKHAAQADSVPVVLLRLFHVYGPWESAHRLGPTSIRNAFSGDPLTLSERGIRRDWVYVDDVCEAMLLAVNKGQNGEIFNIGTGIETANEEFIACVESITDRSIHLALGEHPRRVTDSDHRFADAALAADVLGWRPRHDLAEGVRRTVEWYKANPLAWSNINDLRTLTA